MRQIVYTLYRSKEITKKVCNNIINSIKVSTFFKLGFLNHNTKWVQSLWTQKIVEVQNIMF